MVMKKWGAGLCLGGAGRGTLPEQSPVELSPFSMGCSICPLGSTDRHILIPIAKERKASPRRRKDLPKSPSSPGTGHLPVLLPPSCCCLGNGPRRKQASGSGQPDRTLGLAPLSPAPCPWSQALFGA